MIVVGKGHVLRAIGFTRKTLGADTHMESVCGERGVVRDGEMKFYYPELMARDARLVIDAVACPICRALIAT